MQYYHILIHSRYDCYQAMRRTLEKSPLNPHSGPTLPPIEHVVLLGGLSPRVKPPDLNAGHNVKV